MKLDQQSVAVTTEPNDAKPILVVDDSQLQRRILSSTLKRMGYPVVEASTAAQALDICATGSVQIVLSDWMMPEIDGLQFCQRLRALGLEGYVYFILLTSKGEKDEVAQGFDAGADDFLTKPVNGVELRARIAAGNRILSMQSDLQEKNRVVAATLDELREVYEALDRDLIEARKLQHSLIREPVQTFGATTVRYMLQSCGRVGGDLVGGYKISKDRIGVYSIDVSGHGVASALLSARIAGYLSPTDPDQNIGVARTEDGYTGIPPAEVVATLNRLILDEIETEHYFTICLAEIDLASGCAKICQAGHPASALHRQGESVEFVGDGGFPVGLIDGATFSEHAVKLNPGDRLLLYSDGITECADQNGTLLDYAGLKSFLIDNDPSKGEVFFDRLLDRLTEYSGGQEMADDVSAVLVEFQRYPNSPPK